MRKSDTVEPLVSGHPWDILSCLSRKLDNSSPVITNTQGEDIIQRTLEFKLNQLKMAIMAPEDKVITSLFQVFS